MLPHSVPCRRRLSARVLELAMDVENAFDNSRLGIVSVMSQLSVSNLRLKLRTQWFHTRLAHWLYSICKF